MRTDKREPYTLFWQEQGRLFSFLPEHLRQMPLFKVNTGCRDQGVCGLQWNWEQKIPELSTSVFVVPKNCVKNCEYRLVVLNREAERIIESVRGQHLRFVFVL